MNNYSLHTKSIWWWEKRDLLLISDQSYVISPYASQTIAKNQPLEIKIRHFSINMQSPQQEDFLLKTCHGQICWTCPNIIGSLEKRREKKHFIGYPMVTWPALNPSMSIGCCKGIGVEFFTLPLIGRGDKLIVLPWSFTTQPALASWKVAKLEHQLRSRLYNFQLGRGDLRNVGYATLCSPYANHGHAAYGRLLSCKYDSVLVVLKYD